VRNEPLATYHVKWFANLQLDRLPEVPYATNFIKLFVRRALVPLTQLLDFHKLFRGHTIYVVLEKTATGE
jgi:hypothetical protein